MSEGIKRYTKLVGQAQETYVRELNKIRLAALTDTDLPDLQRAVMGILGSPDKLIEYQRLDEKMVSYIGKPIVRAVRYHNSAKGGIIAGGLAVKFMGPHKVDLKESPHEITSASILVPVKSYASMTNYGRGGENPQIYTVSNTQDQTADDDLMTIEVARMGRDFNNRITDTVHEDIYIDRPEIYGSPLFKDSLSHLMQAIEENRIVDTDRGAIQD